MAIRQVVGAVGAVVGYWIGGPTGAQYGWTIGSLVGGFVDPQIINGPKIGDLAQQTSQEGGPIPIVFGLSPPMAGNIIYADSVKKVVKKKSQGKGGPKVKTTSLYRTYAIGICEGPITSIIRIWRNGELIFDGKGVEDANYHQGTSAKEIFLQVLQIISNNKVVLDRMNIHLGAYDQAPDSDLEEITGVGTTPAYRGLAYLTFRDDDLTDLRGAVPQYMFQVERCEGAYLTSRPYSIEDTEALDTRGTVDREAPVAVLREALDTGGSVTEGELKSPLVEYGEWPPEALDTFGGLVDGDLRNILRSYDNYEPEALDSFGTVLSGEHKVILIPYTNAEPEALDSFGAVKSGSLT